MIDAVSKKPLRVLVTKEGGPYVDVPGSQLAKVEKLLKENGMYCWPDPSVMSINGGPAIGTINLGKNGNAAKAQAVLDSVP